MATQYRYSRPKFQVTLAVALALTAMVTWLAWMMLTAFGNQHARAWSALVALVFFGFVSARAILRFLRDAVVVAVYPTGLLDARRGPDIVPWDEIREIVLRQSEREFELDVYLWKPQARAESHVGRPDFTMELAPLDADAGEIVAAIGRHARIRGETGLLLAPTP